MSAIVRVTPFLPKLVEAAARNCYNSFHLSKPDSHQLVKNLMNMPKPHLSIGHHGNILVCLTMPETLTAKEIKHYDEVLSKTLLSLLRWSHNYLTISTRSDCPDSAYDAVISGNPVAWKNAYDMSLRVGLNEVTNSDDKNKSVCLAKLLNAIFAPLLKEPESLFFVDKEEGYAHVTNPYLLTPNEFDDKRNKLLVSDDFSDILTPEERELHETATVVMSTSRDMSMQINRHDAGISQLSQRYVLPFDLEGKTFKQFMEEFEQDVYNVVKFKYHVPEGISLDEVIKLYVDDAANQETKVTFDPNMHLWNREMTYEDMMEVIKTFFFSVFFHQMQKGEKHKRANEQARSLLPNNMDTIIYYTRPKWRWRHYIDLRTDNHTQIEARRESIPLLETLQQIGWFNEYRINHEKMTADKYLIGVDLAKGEKTDATN